MSILSSIIGRGLLASRPAAGSPGRVYFVTDGTPGLYRDNGSSWDSIGETGAAVTWADLDDDHDAHDHTGVPGVGGGGGGDLYGIHVADVPPGSPHASDDEFDTPDTDPLTGWTTIGTPTHDIDTTVPHNYYLTKTTGGTQLHGIEKAFVPINGSRATARLSSYRGPGLNGNAHHVGLFVYEGAGGDYEMIGPHRAAGLTTVFQEHYNTPASGPNGLAWQLNLGALGGGLWLQFRFTAANAWTTFMSLNGSIWIPMNSGASRSPFTVARVGIGYCTENSAGTGEAAFDWIRFA